VHDGSVGGVGGGHTIKDEGGAGLPAQTVLNIIGQPAEARNDAPGAETELHIAAMVRYDAIVDKAQQTLHSATALPVYSTLEAARAAGHDSVFIRDGDYTADASVTIAGVDNLRYIWGESRRGVDMPAVTIIRDDCYIGNVGWTSTRKLTIEGNRIFADSVFLGGTSNLDLGPSSNRCKAIRPLAVSAVTPINNLGIDNFIENPTFIACAGTYLIRMQDDSGASGNFALRGGIDGGTAIACASGFQMDVSQLFVRNFTAISHTGGLVSVGGGFVASYNTVSNNVAIQSGGTASLIGGTSGTNWQIVGNTFFPSPGSGKSNTVGGLTGGVINIPQGSTCASNLIVSLLAVTAGNRQALINAGGGLSLITGNTIVHGGTALATAGYSPAVTLTVAVAPGDTVLTVGDSTAVAVGDIIGITGKELIRVNSKTATTLTVVRAAFGTGPALSHANGSTVVKGAILCMYQTNTFGSLFTNNLLTTSAALIAVRTAFTAIGLGDSTSSFQHVISGNLFVEQVVLAPLGLLLLVESNSKLNWKESSLVNNVVGTGNVNVFPPGDWVLFPIQSPNSMAQIANNVGIITEDYIFSYVDDFTMGASAPSIVDNINWDFDTTGAVTYALQAASGGVIRLTTTTTVRAAMQKGHDFVVIANALGTTNFVDIEFILTLVQLTDTRLFAGAGTTFVSNTIPTNFAGVSYDSALSANWRLATAVAGVITYVDSGIAATTGKVKLRVRDVGGEIRLYVDGVVKARQTTAGNIPGATLRPGLTIFPLAAATKSVDWDTSLLRCTR
jgi:hypothetical protein